jgi:hypothetical protein
MTEPSPTPAHVAVPMPRRLRRRLMRRLRRLRNISIVLLGLGGAVVALGAWVWSKREALVHRELTNLLRVPVGFQRVEIELTDDYRGARVRIQGLEVGCSNPRAAQSPYVVDSASMDLNLTQFLKPNTPRKLHNITLWGTKLHFYIDENYTGNFRLFAHYDAWRPAPDSVLLPKFEVIGLNYHYHQLAQSREYVLKLDTLHMGLVVRRQEVDVQANATGRSGYWREGDFSLLEDRPMGLRVHTVVSKPKQVMYVQDAELTLNGARFNVKGEWPLGRKLYYNLDFASPEGDMEVLLSLMPDRSAEQLRTLKPQGMFAFQGSLRGLSTGVVNPHLDVQFQGRGVSVASGIQGLDLSRVNVRGSYSNGPTNSVATTFIDIEQFQGLLNGRPVQAQFRIDELQNPSIVAQTRVRVSASEIAHIAQLGPTGQMWGYADVNLNVQGALRDMASLGTLNQLVYRGEIVLDSLGMAPTNWPLTLDRMRGTVHFNNDSLALHGVTGQLNGQRFQLSGLAPQFFPYVFQQTPELATTFTVHLDSLRLEELLTTIGALGKEGQQRKAAKLGFGVNSPRKHWLDIQFSPHVSMAFNLTASHVLAAGVLYDSLTAQATLAQQVLNVPQFVLWNTSTEVKGWVRADASAPTTTTANGRLGFNTQQLQLILPAVLRSPRPVAPDSLMAAGFDWMPSTPCRWARCHTPPLPQT